MNSPRSLVTVVDARPVPSCVATTVTPGSTRAAVVDDAADDDAGINLGVSEWSEGRK